MATGLAPTQRGGAVFCFAISAGLLKPLSSLWFASSPSSRRELTEEERISPGSAPSHVAHVATRRAYYQDKHGRRPNKMVTVEYEQNGGPPRQQQERGPFLRPLVILLENDLTNAVQLIERVRRDTEFKYLDSGKIVASPSLPAHEGSQRMENPSWVEIFHDLAEITARDVTKGDVILVAGKIVVNKRVKDNVRCTLIKMIWPGFEGAKQHGINHLAQQETTRAGASKWKEGATMTEQKRKSSRKVVDGVESYQPNTDSVKGELKEVEHVEANYTASRGANDVLELREPEPLFGEEERRISPRPKGVVSENSVRQDLRTSEVHRKAFRMDFKSSPAWMKARLNLIGEGRLQSRASYGTRDWSRDTVRGTGSSQVDRFGTTRDAIAGLQSRLQRGITTDSSRVC